MISLKQKNISRLTQHIHIFRDCEVEFNSNVSRVIRPRQRIEVPDLNLHCRHIKDVVTISPIHIACQNDLN